MLQSRREFLKSAGAMPLVFGLGALGCSKVPMAAPPAPAGPPLGPQGLDTRMPGWMYTSFSWILEGRPGVIVRVPRSERERRALGEGLIDRSARGSLDAREVFVEAVFVCLDDAAIAKYVAGARTEESAILVDGRTHDQPLVRVDGMSFAPADAKDPAKFAAAFRRLVHGPADERLKARAAAARAKAPAEAIAALDRLASMDDRGMAGTFARDLAAAIVLARQEAGPGTRRDALTAVLSAYLDEGWMAMGNTILPWGIDRSSTGGGCGRAGSNVACGMASPTPGSYRFVGYLAGE